MLVCSVSAFWLLLLPVRLPICISVSNEQGYTVVIWYSLVNIIIETLLKCQWASNILQIFWNWFLCLNGITSCAVALLTVWVRRRHPWHPNLILFLHRCFSTLHYMLKIDGTMTIPLTRHSNNITKTLVPLDFVPLIIRWWRRQGRNISDDPDRSCAITKYISNRKPRSKRTTHMFEKLLWRFSW